MVSPTAAAPGRVMRHGTPGGRVKDSLESTLQKLAEALQPYRASVVLTASTPYGGDPWLRIGIESAESLAAARATATKIVGACERRLGLIVYVPLDGRLVLSLWNKIGYFEGLGLLKDYLAAIANGMPSDAPPDINGFALWLTDHSTDAAFSTRTAIAASQADYARSSALRGESGDPSFIRVHIAEWSANRPWKGDYIYRLKEYEPWEQWTLRARGLLDRLHDEHDEIPSLYSDWMVMLCADAIRSALPKFLALPNVTDDFIAFVDQGDVDEHTRLLDLARTLGFEHAAALLPLVPITRLN
jgi:hypothetical protein